MKKVRSSLLVGLLPCLVLAACKSSVEGKDGLTVERFERAEVLEKRAAANQTVVCMKRIGFDYKKDVDARPENYFGLFWVEPDTRKKLVKDFGYGVLLQFDKARLTEATQPPKEGFKSALIECQKKVSQLPLSKFRSATGNSYAREVDAIFSSEKWLEADNLWNNCMVKAGFSGILSSYTAQDNFNKKVERLWEISDLKQQAIAVEQLRIAEIAQAKSDDRCRSDHLDRVEWKMVTSAKEKLISEISDEALAAIAEYESEQER
jgi:hypothetical protein